MHPIPHQSTIDMNDFKSISHMISGRTGTFKSPEILAPARMPVAAGKKTPNTEKKL